MQKPYILVKWIIGLGILSWALYAMSPFVWDIGIWRNTFNGLIYPDLFLHIFSFLLNIFLFYKAIKTEKNWYLVAMFVITVLVVIFFPLYDVMNASLDNFGPVR